MHMMLSDLSDYDNVNVLLVLTQSVQFVFYTKNIKIAYSGNGTP